MNLSSNMRFCKRRGRPNTTYSKIYGRNASKVPQAYAFRSLGDGKHQDVHQTGGPLISVLWLSRIIVPLAENGDLETYL